MRLSELGLRPATIACLHNAGINTIHQLREHTCRELIWHSQIEPGELYEVLRALQRQGIMLKPTTNRDARLLNERNLEVFRLRVVEGRTLRETGGQVGIGFERVRQILSFYFGLHGEPPAVKARPRQGRKRTSPPSLTQVGRAIQRVRSAKGLTIDELASATDMSSEQLARIEDGLRDPTWTTLHRIAVAVGTTTAMLAHAIEAAPRR